MKKLLKRLVRDRKGISMTEVVVAMALVVIVTGAAISVLIASIQFDVKYKAQTHALNACESAVECIRFADGTVGQGSGEIDLGELLSKVGLTLDVERSTENEKIYSFMSGKVTAEVTYTLNGTDIGHYVVILNNEVIYESNESNEEPQ